MKWIGQHIWDFISRFRNDVYFEAVPDGTIASGKNLGLDSNNKLVKESDSGITDLHGAGVDGSANQILTDDGDGTVTSESNLTFASDALSLTSASSNLPSITLTNSNTDANPSSFSFVKTASGSNSDSIGIISFISDDAGDNPTTFATINGSISSTGATDGDERGSFSVKVTTTEGGSSLETGIQLTGSTDGANRLVDVSLGTGTGSTTTLAGVATINSGVVRLGEGNGNDIYVKGFNTTSGNHGGSLYLQACQGNGTNKNGGALQLKAGASTGSGNPGDFFFMSSTTGSSGSSTNGSFQSAALTSEGNLTIAGDLNVGGGNITNAITFDSGLTGTLTGQADTVASIGNLTGDVTSSNRATTIADDAVTYAKMQNVTATDRILGRDSAGAGVVEEITPANLRTMINVEDGATADQTQADINGLAITTTGALDSGSITSGFGAIDNGSSNITTTGTISGGELQVDSTNIQGSRISIVGSTDDACIIDCTTHGATTITTVDTAAAAADLGFNIDGAITATSSSFTATTDAFTVTSGTTFKPDLILENTAADNKPSFLKFFKKRTGTNGDYIGSVTYSGHDHLGNPHVYGAWDGQVIESNHGTEAGRVYGGVSTNGVMVEAFGLEGSNSADIVNASIGYGAASLTTVAGDLKVVGNEIKDDDGTTCITFDSSGNVTTNLLTCTTSASAAITLNHTSATGSPFMAFSQNGTRRSFIQHHDTDNKFRIASEFGAIALEASADGTDSNTAYLVIDQGGTFTLGAENSDVVLTTDGNMTFRVDSDNDETNGNFIFQHNASTQIATLDENGNFATSGVVTAAKGHKYNPTDNTDGSHQGDIVYIDAATASTTAGKVYYLNSSGSWTIANADAEADASGMLAIAIDDDPDVDGMVLRGMVTAFDIAGTPAVGAAVYLSPVDGTLTTVKPSTSTHIVRHVGYILNATHDQIWFNPDSTYIEV